MTNDTDRYAALSEEELLQEIGETLLGDGLGFGGVDPHDAIVAAGKWITDRTVTLQKAVCRADILEFINGNVGDDIAIVSVALIAQEASWAAVGLPVAAVLLRRGIQAFCATATKD